MTSYTANIPQPGDDPSVSQDQILQNFQTLQTLYGTMGDHYPWTNTTPTEGTRHAKVTLPGLPTNNPPGDSVPVPATGEGVAFGLTAGSQTYPFWRRDTGTLNIPMAAFRAFARADGAAFLGIPFNMMTVTQPTTFSWQFTFANPEPDKNYLILATPVDKTTLPIGGAYVSNIETTGFTVTMGSGNSPGMMVAVLRLTL